MASKLPKPTRLSESIYEYEYRLKQQAKASRDVLNKPIKYLLKR